MKIGIVGGGPAGSRTAEMLVRSGARAVVYEARVGWEKPCGGGVPERGVDACPFLRNPAIPQRIARQARFYSCANREAVVPLLEPLRIFSRRDLNRLFLERAGGAGADIRPFRVTGLSRVQGGWRIRDHSGTTETFDFLVGADGASGMVRGRVLAGAGGMAHTMGLGYYLEGYTCEEVILKFFPGLDGYLWIFPRTDHLAAGICGPPGSGRAGALRGELEKFLVDLFGAPVLRRLRNYGARIPSLSPGESARQSCQGEGWALVGDAAGFVDPLTREGIHYAIASADLLADALGRGQPAGYGERWDQAFGEEMGWAARHRQLFFSRSFLEAFTLLTGASPAVQGVVSDLIAGRQSYGSLLRRLAGNVPAAAASLAMRLAGRFLRGTPRRLPPRLTPLAG